MTVIISDRKIQLQAHTQSLCIRNDFSSNIQSAIYLKAHRDNWLLWALQPDHPETTSALASGVARAKAQINHGGKPSRLRFAVRCKVGSPRVVQRDLQISTGIINGINQSRRCNPVIWVCDTWKRQTKWESCVLAYQAKRHVKIVLFLPDVDNERFN